MVVIDISNAANVGDVKGMHKYNPKCASRTNEVSFHIILNMCVFYVHT